MEKTSETVSLDELFKYGFKAVKSLEDMTPDDPKYIETVTTAIRKLEECTVLVNQLSLYSVNETTEEIATPLLKFLLLPALLSNLSTRKRDDRLLLIEQSEVYLKDFLKRCSEYGLTQWKEKSDAEDESNKSLEQAARDRNTKIGRYREEKRLEGLLLTVEKRVEEGSLPEDEVREYYLNLIRYWCQKAVDDLELVQQEKKVLEYMRSKPSKKAEEGATAAPKRPFKPFIITKTEAQKKVYGAGYPSLPVLTVDQFYEQKYGNGAEASGHCPAGHSLQKWAADPEANEREIEQETAEKEDKVANDDPEELARMRDWDAWKDDNRRGDGNRKNKG